MSEKKNERDDSTVELAYASLALFADDGTLDLEELDSLLRIALRDQVVTDGEKEILRNIFNRLHEEDVTAEVWDKTQQVRKQHGI